MEERFQFLKTLDEEIIEMLTGRALVKIPSFAGIKVFNEVGLAQDGGVTFTNEYIALMNRTHEALSNNQAIQYVALCELYTIKGQTTVYPVGILTEDDFIANVGSMDLFNKWDPVRITADYSPLFSNRNRECQRRLIQGCYFIPDAYPNVRLVSASSYCDLVDQIRRTRFAVRAIALIDSAK